MERSNHHQITAAGETETWGRLDKSRLTSLLLGILVLITTVDLLVVASTFIGEGLSPIFWTSVSLLPILVVLALLAAHGHTTTVTWALIVLLYAFIATVTIFRGTIRNPSCALVIVVAAISGLILGRRGMIQALMAGVLVLGGLALAEFSGLLRTMTMASVFTFWLAISAFASCVGAVIVVARQMALDALNHASRELAERREAERSLSKSETLYRGLFESAADALLVLQDEILIDCNPAAARIFGVAQREDLIGKHPSGLSSPIQMDGEDSRIAATRRLELVRSQGNDTFEWLHRRLDSGEVFTAEVRLNQVQIDGQSFIQAAVRDITERKRAEQWIRASEKRLQSILDNSGLVVYLKDVEGRYVSVNRRFEEVFQLDGKAVVGRKDHDIFPREAADRYLQHDSLAVKKGGPVEQEELILHGDGVHTYLSSRFPLSDSSGKLYGLGGIATDITDRLSTDAKFRAVVEQSLMGVTFLDGEKVMYANPRAGEIFGYVPADWVGRSFLPLVAEEDRKGVREASERLMRREIKAARSQYRVVRKDGEVVRLGTESVLIQMAGAPVLVTVMQDITYKFRAEEKVRDYVVRLEKSVLSTVSAVSQMMDMRDPYTQGHERRVGEIAADLAAEMGLDAEVQRGLRVAGAVHDVGKITVPAEILGKPGRLSAAEFEIIRTHAEQGYEVLKGIDFPWPVAEVARQHHERLDGSGYPRRLKGEEILLEARILAVADVVEAMASHRPYRPGLGIEAALAEIERGRGTAYDQNAADACLRLFREKGYQLPA